MPEKILIIISGIPCSGKSTITSYLANYYKFSFNIIIIERDVIFHEIITQNLEIGRNKRDKLISAKMNELYEVYNNSPLNTILIVDSCSGNDGVKSYIQNKATSSTKYILINIIAKLIQLESGDEILDIPFYIQRAINRPPHQVFPHECKSQILELYRCHKHWTHTKEFSNFTIIDFNAEWLLSNDNPDIQRIHNLIS
jgi:hypothetical protein